MAAAHLMSPAGMLLLAAFAGLVKLIDINFETRMQHAIPAERRATIASLAGFLWTLGSIGLYLAFGWFTRGQLLSLPLIVLGLVLLAMSRRAPVLQPLPAAGDKA